MQSCLAKDLYQVASSYLLVLHNLEPLEQCIKDTVRLFRAARAAEQWLVSLHISEDCLLLTRCSALQGASSLPLFSRQFWKHLENSSLGSRGFAGQVR